MSDPKRILDQSYVCPKCHGRNANVCDVVLAKSGLLRLVPSKDNRYIEVTCVLCGFTEFYNRAIFVKSDAVVKIPKEVPLAENID